MKNAVHTLRFRLTVSYALILSLILAAFGGLLYGLVRYQLLHHHDGELVEAAGAVSGILSEEEDCAHLTESQRRRLDQIGHLVLFHEVEGEGRVFYRSPDSSGLPDPAQRYALSRPASDAARFETVPGAKAPSRMYSLPYSSRSGRRGVIHVVHGLGDVPGPLASLRISFFLMAPVAVLLSAAAGWWLAARALAPVDAATRTAREIEASSLSRRLPVPKGHDEMTRLVATFNQMFARLEASFEGMKRFTADAAHELRSPLATMRGAIDVALALPREASEYHEVLASVGEDVDRLRSIAEDLLVLARADAGRIKLDKSAVRWDVAVAEVVGSFQPIAAKRGVSLRAECAPGFVLQGDERWLRQLLFNLIDNALKFSAASDEHERPRLVSVELTRSSSSARLDVVDSGPGMPSEALGRVFERFYRLDGVHSILPTEGSGLGLAIAAWIVEAHGGTITAQNRPEGGCVLSVSLPLDHLA